MGCRWAGSPGKHQEYHILVRSLRGRGWEAWSQAVSSHTWVCFRTKSTLRVSVHTADSWVKRAASNSQTPKQRCPAGKWKTASDSGGPFQSSEKLLAFCLHLHKSIQRKERHSQSQKSWRSNCCQALGLGPLIKGALTYIRTLGPTLSGWVSLGNILNLAGTSVF